MSRFPEMVKIDRPVDYQSSPLGNSRQLVRPAITFGQRGLNYSHVFFQRVVCVLQRSGTEFRPSYMLVSPRRVGGLDSSYRVFWWNVQYCSDAVWHPSYGREASERRLMIPKPDWRHLAEQASVEMDSNRLTALVQELIKALEEEENVRHQNRGLICSSILPVREAPPASYQPSW